MNGENPLHFKTYGCKVNTYDTGLLQKRLSERFQFQTERPIHILNTCAVTREATLEAVRESKRIKRKNSDALVVVTGCAAQVDTDEFRTLSEADLVVANSHKGQIEELIVQHLKGELTEKVFKSNIFKKDDLEAGGGVESHHTRSFLKIQDGCNSFCTFCVIPFARGKSRSLSIEALRQRVNEFYEKGFREVVLTGVHIGDFEQGLENLVEDLLEKTRMPRLRLASLEPIEVSERLLRAFQNDRLCAHFHMSIQSANTEVLKNMKRQYSADEVESALLRISESVPHAFVGMDVIAGFVGESDEQFEDTYLRLARLPWTRLHVFPYSERPGTFALKLQGKLTPQTISRRAAQLRELSWNRLLSEAQKQVGSTKKVLFLQNQKAESTGSLSAVARDQWAVEVAGPEKLEGAEAAVTITGFRPRPHKQDVVLLGAY